MAQNFGRIPSHQCYVLNLYRTVLRNVPKNCHSYAFQNEIKTNLSRQLTKHKHDKSSWSVYILLEKFNQLNNYLLEGKLQEIKHLIQPLKKTSKQLKTTRILNSLNDLGNENLLQSPGEIRELHALSTYIKQKQDICLLPRYIPKKYKLNLLLPLALNDRACVKLYNIHQKLEKGSPSARLSYTKEGRNQIWFVRSPINKGKRQSKMLGILIRQERKDSQKNIDDINFCESNATWALHEAIWEEYLESKRTIEINLAKYLEYNIDNPNKPARYTPASRNKKINDWVDPVREVMFNLQAKSIQKVVYYSDYKEKLLSEDGQLAYLDKLSKAMYAKRLDSFEKMTEEALPYVTPFIPKKDLSSVLTKYGF